MFRDFGESVSDLPPGRVGILLLIDANPGVAQSRPRASGGLALKRKIRLYERRVAARLSADERAHLLLLLEKLARK